MLIENQKIKVRWREQTREHYESLGYVFTKTNDEFYVSPEELTDGSHAKVKVRCDYCGKVVDVAWRDYKKYNGDKYACQSCKGTKISEETLESRRNYLYDKALEFCNEKGYELITPKENITSADSRVQYICPIHGVHETKIYTLITRHICIDCGYQLSGAKSRLDQEEVNNRISECGGVWLNKGSYTGWADKNMIIECPSCHQPFVTSLNAFTSHGIQYCPNCSTSESNGEKAVRLFLEKNNIQYFQEYRFYDCRDKSPLPFDFYMPEINTAIEFQGAQHYGSVSKFGDESGFELRKMHDEIKRNYCNSHNIKLIEIPYWDMKNVNQVLEEKLIA